MTSRGQRIRLKIRHPVTSHSLLKRLPNGREWTRIVSRETSRVCAWLLLKVLTAGARRGRIPCFGIECAVHRTDYGGGSQHCALVGIGVLLRLRRVVHLDIDRCVILRNILVLRNRVLVLHRRRGHHSWSRRRIRRSLIVDLPILLLERYTARKVLHWNHSIFRRFQGSCKRHTISSNHFKKAAPNSPPKFAH